MNYLDYLATVVRGNPDRVAVRHGEETWSYATLLADAKAGANVLVDAGVEAGDAVLLVAQNTYGFVTATLATLARQAVLVPVNTRFRRREVASLVERVDPVAAIAGPSERTVVAAALREADGVDPADVATFAESTAPTESRADLSGVASATAARRRDEDTTSETGRPTDPPLTWRDWGGALADTSEEYVLPETMSDREAFVLHTSGSTGHAKGVRHTHGNLAAVADAAIANYEMDPGSTFLAVMPLYHCTGMGTVLGATLKVGGELLLRREWDPEATLADVEAREVTVFSGVPAMFKDWLAVADEGAVDVDATSLRTGVIGGAGVSAELIRRAEDLLGCPVLNGWGMTETFAGGLWEDRRRARRLPSVGRRTGRLFETRVVDPETGAEQPRGTDGELLVRGDALMTGYLDREATWTDDWLHTRDFARIDDGFVYVLDRAAYTIITGGENVYPQEVEGVIEELSGVREAAVVGKPDERKGEKPVGFVVRLPEAALGAEDVREHVLSSLAAYKHPREVYFVESLPRNAVGKVDREALEGRL